MKIAVIWRGILITLTTLLIVITFGSYSASENFTQVTLIEGLEHPWGMDWLPTGEILITERPGRLRIVRDGQLDLDPISGVPRVLALGQGGLLDVAVHPRFAENGYIYLTYADGTETTNQTKVARGVFNGVEIENLETIFAVDQPKTGGQHFGSRILWLPDETMLVTIGDGGNPPLQLEGQLIREQAQNLQSYLGKVIRINDDGSIPSDNPFVGESGVNPLIWSYGHRNIQGIAFDSVNNRIWSTEHGSRGGDELNLLKPGENYGWPEVSHSLEYSTGEPVSAHQSLPGMIDPREVWTPAIAPSGLTVYYGDRFANWSGNLLAGGLVSQSVHRIELDDSGNVINQEQIPINQRVRDVRTGPDGLIYILTDRSSGQLIRLDPR
ncbi:MAG: PQQ-dependent sugar dehydrogenase [Gloeocapsa sp. DLM2.Bin57]|nr:MAG: PQQ-dependent sugar dehydrogenase [Gloeocapsa sp. DLM2.Bin57]